MKILGIESTCDETGVALVDDGQVVLCEKIGSSAGLMQKFKGVVPEVAAREQIKIIIPLLASIVPKADFADVDAIAVSYGPGLIGSLLVGVETAKALAYATDKPIVAVNHLKGHIYSNWLRLESNSKYATLNSKKPEFPLIALVVSGGHTDLVLMKGHSHFKLLGSTLDDACGEAFDKVAKFLGLGYPGGPEVERVARKFETRNSKSEMKTYPSKSISLKFPRPMIGSRDFNFSFSGLKTAVVNSVGTFGKLSASSSQLTVHRKEQIAYEFQEAVCDVLITKTLKAANKYAAKSIVVGGGVAANNGLRKRLTENGRQNRLQVYFAQKKYCVDNGAMIAAAAYYQKKIVDPLTLSADPHLHF